MGFRGRNGVGAGADSRAGQGPELPKQYRK